MSTFYYRTAQVLPVNMQAAWTFFSSPHNLALITPPEMDFNVLTDSLAKEIYEGMLIDYSVKPLFGIPVHWQTEISAVNKPTLFVDEQRKGPYKQWVHQHFFQDLHGSTLMIDEVTYQLPYGWLGNFIHKLLVRKKIEQIFRFRKKAITHILSTHATHSS